MSPEIFGGYIRGYILDLVSQNIEGKVLGVFIFNKVTLKIGQFGEPGPVVRSTSPG